MSLLKNIFKFLSLTFSLTVSAQSLTQIGQTIYGEDEDDASGFSVSLSSDGNTVAIGAPYNDTVYWTPDAGHVRIFRNLNGTWKQKGSDIDGDRESLFGYSVSLSSDGNTVAIGGIGKSTSASVSYGKGLVKIYRNLIAPDVWVQIGQTIYGEDEGDASGYSVSLSSDGNTVAIGAPYNEAKFFDSLDRRKSAGHVRVYNLDPKPTFGNPNGKWIQMGSDFDAEAVNEYYGNSVSLSSDGKTLAIGAPSVGGTNKRYVSIYNYMSGTWTKVGSDIEGVYSLPGGLYGLFGWSVSLSSDGSTVAILDRNYDGRVKIYKNNSGTWTQVGSEINGDKCLQLGKCISLSGDGNTLAVEGNKRCQVNGGSVRIYKNISGTWIKQGPDFDIWESWVNSNLSLSSDGSTLAIGAPSGGTLPDLNKAGYVRIYKLCDSNLVSVQPIDLDILPSKNAEFSVVPSKTGLKFQWQLDQGSGFQFISDTGQYSGTQTERLSIFSVNVSNDNQKYRCIIKDGECSDTSVASTLTINKASIIEIPNNEAFRIYPNPASDILHILTNSNHIGTIYAIKSISGQKILGGKLEREDTIINIRELLDGIYFIHLGSDIRQSFKIIKQQPHE